MNQLSQIVSMDLHMIHLTVRNMIFNNLYNTLVIIVDNIVTNLTRTLQSSRFLGGPIFYPVFKNGATGSTPSPFLGGFSIF
jgi:hypothetical protein